MTNNPDDVKMADVFCLPFTKDKNGDILDSLGEWVWDYDALTNHDPYTSNRSWSEKEVTYAMKAITKYDPMKAEIERLKAREAKAVELLKETSKFILGEGCDGHCDFEYEEDVCDPINEFLKEVE